MSKKMSITELSKCDTVRFYKSHYVEQAFLPMVMETRQADIELEPAADGKTEMCLPPDDVERLKAIAAAKIEEAKRNVISHALCFNCSKQDCVACPYMQFMD